MGPRPLSALEPHHQNVYVNFLMEEGEERVREAYGGEKVRPVEGVKAQVQPETTSSG